MRIRCGVPSRGASSVVLLVAAFCGGRAVGRAAEPARRGRTRARPAGRGRMLAPAVRVSWQWQLADPPKASALLDVQMYDVDGFDTPKSLVAAMHTAGSRPSVTSAPAPGRTGAPMPATSRRRCWAGRTAGRASVARHPPSRELGPIMRGAARHVRAQGVRRRRVRQRRRVHERAPGFPLTGARSASLQRVPGERGASPRPVGVAEERHRPGPALLPYFDVALNEQCFQYAECGTPRAVRHGGQAGLRRRVQVGRRRTSARRPTRTTSTG